jgi:hypothetical protein
MAILCAIIVPPPSKVKRAKTLPRSEKYYTIHSHSNNVFGVRIRDDTPTLMVGFKNYEDAHLMGRMLETYYIYNQDLPLACKINEFILPSHEESIDELKHLTILHNDVNNLLSWCMINFLDFLGVEEIIENDDTGKYTWDVSLCATEPEIELCKERFDYLYELE